MQISKNKILKANQKKYWVIDNLFYQGENYVLATEMLENDSEEFGPVSIFKEINRDNQLLVKQVREEAILKDICPLFEKNFKENLV